MEEEIGDSGREKLDKEREAERETAKKMEKGKEDEKEYRK